MHRHLCLLIAGAVVLIHMTGCGSTTPAMPNPITEPVIDQPGQHIVRYRDQVVEVIVESGFADENIGSDWLVLNVAFSGMTGGATSIDRTLVSVRTPGGETVPLPSYREFNRAFDQLASTERRASLTSQPLDFTRGGRRACALAFMPKPGSGVAARSTLHVTKNELCTGLLYFRIPGAVQPGPWELVIEFEESRAEVPFTLGSS